MFPANPRQVPLWFLVISLSQQRLISILVIYVFYNIFSGGYNGGLQVLNLKAK